MKINKSVIFETVARDCLIHGREEKGDFVVRDAFTLTRLYSEMYPPCPIPEEKPKPPQIDFDTQMVIAVFQGACPSGGYDIEIKSLDRIMALKRDNENLEVLVKETSPEHEEGFNGSPVLTMAETYPTHIIKTKRYDGKVNFKRE